jgi:UDP:flavonoid glycosyltransferase YjiC (YdhE family)
MEDVYRAPYGKFMILLFFFVLWNRWLKMLIFPLFPFVLEGVVCKRNFKVPITVNKFSNLFFVDIYIYIFVFSFTFIPREDSPGI